MKVLRWKGMLAASGSTEAENSAPRRTWIVPGQCLAVWLLLTFGMILTTFASGLEELIPAVESGDVAKVEALLDSGADVNAKTHTGATPLIYASWHGHTDVVKALLDHGADVNTVTHDGKTALSIASEKRHSEIVKLLQEHRQGGGSHGHDEANDVEEKQKK